MSSERAAPVAPADPAARQRKIQLGSTLLLAAWLLVVAFAALPARIQPGDAGEFATVMLRGGVPHPSGYPWMRILGLLARGLESLGMPPVQAAALPCALAGVAGWVLLQRCALRLTGATTRGILVATLVVTGVATSPVVVRHTVDSEVWGLLVLFTAVVVHQALTAADRPLRLGFVFGLAISHHLTAALLLPLVVATAWPRETKLRPLARTAVHGIAGGVVGLLPYATLAVGDGTAWRWGDTRNAVGLARHVLRADYGVFSLSLHEGSVPATAQLERVLASLGDALSLHVVTGWGAGCAVVLCVLVGGLVRHELEPRVRWGLALTAIASGLLFPLAHNIDPASPFGSWILERFDILPLTLLALLEACACMVVLERLTKRRAQSPASRWRWPQRVVTVTVLVLLARQQILTLRHHAPSTDDWVGRYAADVLATPQAGQRTIIFGTNDHRSFPILFAQEVLGLGPHVIYIDASLLGYDWYRQRLRATMPGIPDIDKPLRLMGYLWQDRAWKDTPIYLANIFSRPAAALARVPEGLLWRVIPPGHEHEFAPAEVLARHEEAFARYDLQAPPPGPQHPFAQDVWSLYLDQSQALKRLAGPPRAETPHD